MSRPIMLINSHICMNCKACIVACQQRNNVPYGHARNWIRETPSPGAPLGLAFQPGGCMHCQDAPCVQACPTAATYRAADGTVRTDQHRCIGCGACVTACPYSARFLHPHKNVADKCDYCGNGDPACVAVCPSGCRIFGDADDPDSPVSQALKNQAPFYLTPENCNPRPSLAYLGATTPTKLQPFHKPAEPIDMLTPLSQGLSWVGGITLVLLAGVMGKQFLVDRKSEQKPGKEDEK